MTADEWEEWRIQLNERVSEKKCKNCWVSQVEDVIVTGGMRWKIRVTTGIVRRRI